MTEKEAKKRIEKLKKVINEARYAYHVLDKSIMSEAALDSLKHELYQLEQKFPEFQTPDSPTQRVGGKPLESFRKVEHKVPMISIEDVFSKEEIEDWEEYLKRLFSEEQFDYFRAERENKVLPKASPYFAELKIDGFAISLIYKNGIFHCGSTRGDGKIGEDVTQNLKTIESIPLRLEIKGKLPNKIIEEKVKKLIEKAAEGEPRSPRFAGEAGQGRGEIEVRGEVYMNVKDFEKLNKELEKKGEKTFANPRNLSAGSIRQLNPKLAASRPLKFLAYDIITDLGQTKHSEDHQILPVLGFKTDKGKECKKLDEVIDFWKEISKKRKKFPFQIDGIVVNINDNLIFQKLGVVGKSPRAVRAFKFSPKQATTVIEDIKLQVGRTGALTPVAILKPVEVGGVTISRATLHNEDEIKRLGVKIGDTVIVGRAGDVIPDIIQVLPELRTGGERKFKMPKKCPVCGEKLIKPEGEAIWRCPNPNCLARQREYFYHFTSKGAFDIIGLGPKIVDKLLDAGLISDPADLFTLEIGDIIPLENLPRRKSKASLRGFAEKSAQNLINAIQSKKKINLSHFIYALGIRNVGMETAQDLAQYFSAQGGSASGWGSLEKLKEASLTDLQEVMDIGPVVAKSIYDFFQHKRNLKFIEKLMKVGVEIILEGKSKYQPFKGKTFVLTGALKTMAREKSKEKIRFLGGKISESVSKKTDFVVVGKGPGSKYEKAKKYGIKIIDEEAFLKLISRQ